MENAEVDLPFRARHTHFGSEVFWDERTGSAVVEEGVRVEDSVTELNTNLEYGKVGGPADTTLGRRVNGVRGVAAHRIKMCCSNRIRRRVASSEEVGSVQQGMVSRPTGTTLDETGKLRKAIYQSHDHDEDNLNNISFPWLDERDRSVTSSGNPHS